MIALSHARDMPATYLSNSY